MLAVHSCWIFHASVNRQKQPAISGIQVKRTGQLCELLQRERKKSVRHQDAINPTFFIYFNLDWLFFSLINYVWVVQGTLSNVDQAGTDFSNKSSHQQVLISSAQMNVDWNRWSTRKNSTKLSVHQEKAGSWIQVGRTLQDIGRMLLGSCLATQLLPSSEP